MEKTPWQNWKTWFIFCKLNCIKDRGILVDKWSCFISNEKLSCSDSFMLFHYWHQHARHFNVFVQLCTKNKRLYLKVKTLQELLFVLYHTAVRHHPVDRLEHCTGTYDFTKNKHFSIKTEIYLWLNDFFFLNVILDLSRIFKLIF